MVSNAAVGTFRARRGRRFIIFGSAGGPTCSTDGTSVLMTGVAVDAFRAAAALATRFLRSTKRRFLSCCRLARALRLASKKESQRIRYPSMPPSRLVCRPRRQASDSTRGTVPYLVWYMSERPWRLNTCGDRLFECTKYIKPYRPVGKEFWGTPKAEAYL